jgi:hypothetical protein
LPSLDGADAVDQHRLRLDLAAPEFAVIARLNPAAKLLRRGPLAVIAAKCEAITWPAIPFQL